jgi:hypothetical protein
MRPLLRWAWLAAALGAILPGCKSTSPEQAYPNDPLLISKKPIEGKPEQSRPSAILNREPQVPPLPPDALVVKSPPAERLLADGR